MIKDLTPLIAMVIIGCLEAAAIFKGIDGAALAGALVVIAALGGYEVKVLKDRRQAKKDRR